jgi:uncharacterized membrane protein YphA (DoxX/SURF4 family)
LTATNEPEAEKLPSDRDVPRVHRLRIALAAATLAMVGLSWPLWIDLNDFPAVPFVRWFPDYPLRWSWLGLLALASGLVAALSDRLGRVGLVLSIAVMIWLVLGDQLRLQPWVYQYLVMGSILATLPPRSALAFIRLYLASMYLHSGLSKLDAPFISEMGLLFVQTLGRILPFDPRRLIPPGREAFVLVLPAFEIVVAILLLIRPTRVVGYLGLVLIHATLLLILGPWGLGHSAIVLVWNVALAVEEFFVFWPIGGGEPKRLVWSWREKLLGVPFALVLIGPFLERIGVLDSWPSHALYASHCERSAIVIQGERFLSLPDALRIAAVPRHWLKDTWDLNPTQWTRAVRGVPAYPQARYVNGLAEWLAGRVGAQDSVRPASSIRVNHSLRPDLTTGERGSLGAQDLELIRDEGDHFWFNAHPRGAKGR